MQQAFRHLEAGVARVCINCGIHGMSTTVNVTLVDIASRFIVSLLNVASELATQRGRTEATVDDIAQAMHVVHGQTGVTTDLCRYILALSAIS